MKIRTDFVTNSSSSSFVVGFKDEESIEPQLKSEVYLGEHFDRVANGDYFYRVLHDIKNNRISKAEAINVFKEEMYFCAEWKLQEEYEKIVGGFLNFCEWVKDHNNNEEFRKKVDECLDTWLEEFKQQIDGFDYLAIVGYDDHCDSNLEHEIMPRLECTIRRFSHH